MKTVTKIVGAVCLMLAAGCGTPLKQAGKAASFTILDRKPHICFVNAGTGIPVDVFDRAASNACAVTHVRWNTVQTKRMNLADITVSQNEQRKMFSDATVLVVYVMNDAGLPRLMSVPGQYSLMNLSALCADKPGGSVFEGRLQRVLMKGLAYAAGVGGTPDPICVMYWNSLTPGTIDATSATYGPASFFALTDILRAAGTEDLFETPE
jgi:hypothetical protein